MERYKGYWIDGSAQIIHPNYRDLQSKGTVLKDGRLISVVEVERFEGEEFSTKEEALAHGLELAKRWVDEHARS
jgi:hypothetical protein